MKYITNECSDGNSSDSKENEYWPYIDTIRPALTKDLLRLLNEVSLHDSHVNSFVVTPKDHIAVLVLDGSSDPWCCTKEPDRARRFTLRYEGVVNVTMLNGSATPVSELDDSDLYCDELELLTDGLFQHRMLFNSGTELHITFNIFRLEYIDEKE
jgi:hypothetical protein